MATTTVEEKSGKVVIKNIGLLLSGDIDHPILDADTVVINDGLITQIGHSKDCNMEGAKTIIDAKMTALAPGLIDLSLIHISEPTRPY